MGDECGQLEKKSAQVEELAISQKKTQNKKKFWHNSMYDVSTIEIGYFPPVAQPRNPNFHVMMTFLPSNKSETLEATKIHRS